MYHLGVSCVNEVSECGIRAISSAVSTTIQPGWGSPLPFQGDPRIRSYGICYPKSIGPQTELPMEVHQNAYKIGDYWNQTEGFEQRGICSICEG